MRNAQEVNINLAHRFGNKLDWKVYSFVQQIFMERVLRSRHYSRHWELNTEQESQCLTLVKFAFMVGWKNKIKEQAEINLTTMYELGQVT